MRDLAVRVVLALASIGAGVIHLQVTPEHFEEYTLFGVFFLALGIFQVLWAGGVIIRPNLLVLSAGVAVSLVVILTWALSRTVGLPIGPEPGEVEAVGALDTLSSALEGLIVVGTIVLLTLPPAERTGQSFRATEPNRRAA